ncbi:MAG: hypothetical protein A2Y25_10105 [Candidatus Melainabacteria bacterium GWF2_37_15]|nr:MAG: hypothetical protein A2Y25_10105 [Candidatus Melainabacteria bacterium GWF2_37_15]
MKLQEVVNDRAFDYKYMYRRMWPFVKPYLFRGLLAIALAVPVGLLDAAIALALKPYLDYVINRNPIDLSQFQSFLVPLLKNGSGLINGILSHFDGFKEINVQPYIDFIINGKEVYIAEFLAFWIPFLVIGVALAQGLLKYFSGYLNDWAGIKMANGLKAHLFAKLLTFESALYDKNSSGLISSRFLGDAGGACAGLLDNLKTIVDNVTRSLGLIAVLLITSWKLSFFALIMLGGAFLPVTLIRKLVKQVSNESMIIGSKLSTSIYETFSGNRIITAFNLQKFWLNKLVQNIHEQFELQMKLTKRVGWLSPLMYLIASFGIAGVMWYGNTLFLSGEMTSGSLTSFVTALLLLYRPIKSMGNTMAGMQGSFVAMNRVMDALDLEPTIKDRPNAVKIDTIKNTIRFENVWFEYDENAPVLKDVSFDIKIGESMALVGNSGGGKTTIANLIPRFYDIKSGSIKIDGIDIRQIELASLRQNIAVVFQDNFLFTGTIRENIILGNFNASDAEIQKAVKDAYLKEFIAELPEGLDTEIGERGVRLSGGQKQRVAIARAMLKNAPVVILDEATSALDNKSEAIVQMAMDKLMENKTVIVIAHRLSTIKNVNKIAVVNEGQIVEMGAHNELIQNPDGAYKMLYDMQFREETEVTA